MSAWWLPGALFNPLTAPASEPLTGPEMLAGPYGLLWFLPLVPLLRLAARRRPRAALITIALLWLLLTLGPTSTAFLLGWVACGAGWVLALDAWRQRGRLGPRTMLAGVWLGLHALALPLWWFPSWHFSGWQPARMPILHNLGFAYFLLRFIAWGHELAARPGTPRRLTDTICWILYPPCMRLGPVLLRETFLERLDQWQPTARPDWHTVGRRLGFFLLGCVALGVTLHNTPRVPAGQLDFFADPGAYRTDQLLACLYLIPVQIYLLLWSYNELAAALAAWVGIRVDDNFCWLPLATSVRDFWRRWHITVGAWVRKCIYIPLGGNRSYVWLNYFAVFIYVAVWHGPSWSFLAWGLAQAAALTAQRLWDRLRQRRGWTGSGGPAGRVLSWLLTMHFAIITIVVFVDFDHLGLRLFAELLRRLLPF